MKSKLIISLIIITTFSFAEDFQFIPADPFNFFSFEQRQLMLSNNQQSLFIRPLLFQSNHSKLSLFVKNQLFFNENGPNLENMGNRWIGKGLSYFTSINISYSSKFINLNIEPYYFINENKYIRNKNRLSPYSEHPNVYNVLNDNRSFSSQPYKVYGIRESILFFNINQIGFGISNTNMWWGPGIHSTLTMTNNTTGFPHIIIGTLNERRINNVGINIRYIFSQLNKVRGDPYFTALVFSTRIYSNPIISFGLSRNYLSGGLPTDRPFSGMDAALLPFESLFIDTKEDKYQSGWEAHDPWDQTMSGFITLEFPASKLKLFIELGTDDHRQNLMDLRSQPDHNAASIIGLRKYSFFNNKSLFGGFEYANIKRSYTYKDRGSGGMWWWKDYYDYSTYDGRRWAAHSGSDSDDFYIFFGYQNNKLTLIPAFNYERHGIISGALPEVKIEFRLDIRYLFKGYAFNFYYEKEIINNSEFEINKMLRSNIFWFGIDKDLNKLLDKYSN